jgi:hypothetical protein
MRYVQFLMSHGMRPYSDITDMNMPGCYLMEELGVAVFGKSDLGWRIYEYLLIAGIGLSGAAIAGRRYWMTGVYGATLFMLVRISDGEPYSMERNEIIALLGLMAMAAFVVSLRRRSPWLAGLGSALACLATAMKPGTFLLEILLVGAAAVALGRQKIPKRDYLLWVLAGGMAVFLVVLVFLLREHAVKSMLFIMTRVWPTFTQISTHRPSFLTAAPKGVLALIPLALVAAYQLRASEVWLRWVFVLAMVYGALSYKLEGSIAPYHRYVFVAFFATWAGWELARALGDSKGGVRGVAYVQLAILLLLVTPRYLLLVNRTSHGAPIEAYAASLQADLSQLGPDKLQGQVECLEMVDGCLRTLYEMRLVQNTGTTGDMLLFRPKADPAVQYYRDWYMQRQEQRPADVVVLGNFFMDEPRSFDRVNNWPAYASLLRNEYVLVRQWEYAGKTQPGYRIYIRKGSGLLNEGQGTLQSGGGPSMR